MKRIILFLIAFLLVFALSACDGGDFSTDESSAESTITESTVSADASIDESIDNSHEVSEPEETLPENPPPEPEGEAMLLEIKLCKAKNNALQKDFSFVIDEGRRSAVLKLDYYNYIDLPTLRRCNLELECSGGVAELSAKNVDGSVDLTKELVCRVTDENGLVRTYAVIVDRAVYELPIINITLGDGKSIDEIDRNETMTMTFSLDRSFEGEYSVSTVGGTIRGRGNSTWNWEKKPYKIKLDEKASLLGMDDNRDWILLANYADKSLIRNTLAYELGRVLDSVSWSPHAYPVDLFVNGEYQGVYTLGEHMEVANGRMELEEGSTEVDTDYLLEVGGMAPTGDVNGVHYFHTKSHLVKFATFKSPDYTEITDAQKKFITDYFEKAEAAIKSGEGYEEYIDVDSFIDWIILHELSYNIDSCFRRSCFLVKEKGGKIKMAAYWDFDLAFGNFSHDNKNYDDLATYGSDEKGAYVSYNWCTYLFRDKEFCERFKARWESLKEQILSTTSDTIDKYGEILNGGSQQQNFTVWDIWDKRAGFQSKWCSAENSFEKQLNYLKKFVHDRAEFIEKTISDLPMSE
ncbi:MAG: CotH kinase family protein [Clostridia bacterium]|nr:CotH kinase family protein [Clostridia bacterium]